MSLVSVSPDTAWKVSVFGVIRVQTEYVENAGKRGRMGTRVTPNNGHFLHGVILKLSAAVSLKNTIRKISNAAVHFIKERIKNRHTDLLWHLIVKVKVSGTVVTCQNIVFVFGEPFLWEEQELGNLLLMIFADIW